MQINKEPECEVIKEKLKKTQKDWIPHFNNKGEKMISVPDIDKILKVLKRFGKKEIRFWTPSQSSRSDYPIRSVVLYFDDFYRFNVVGGSHPDYGNGFSRGVIVPSAQQTRFFTKRAIFRYRRENNHHASTC